MICTFYSRSLSQVHKRTTEEQALVPRASPVLFYCCRERKSELSLCAKRSRFRCFYYYGVFPCFHSYSLFNQHDVLLLSLPSSSSSSALCFHKMFHNFFSYARSTPIHRWIIYFKVFLRLAANNVRARRKQSGVFDNDDDDVLLHSEPNTHTRGWWNSNGKEITIIAFVCAESLPFQWWILIHISVYIAIDAIVYFNFVNGIESMKWKSLRKCSEWPLSCNWRASGRNWLLFDKKHLCENWAVDIWINQIKWKNRWKKNRMNS